jgi:hypothetical protein
MKRSNFMALTSTGMFAGGGTMVGLSFGIVFLGLGGLVPAMSGEQLVALFPKYWIAIACTIIPVALTKTASLATATFSAPKGSDVRRLWLWSFGLWLVNCAITLGYHVQVVIGSFMGKYAPELYRPVAAQLAVRKAPRLQLPFRRLPDTMRRRERPQPRAL